MFQKGKEKTGGRSKGTLNKATGLKQHLDKLLTDNFDKFKMELDALEGKDYVSHYIKLMDYTLPKLTRSQTSINFNEMSDSEVEELLELLTKRVQSNE